MTEKVTIELPDNVAEQVRSIAAHTQRSFEDVLLDWIRRIGGEPALELLPDHDLLVICNTEPDTAEQDQLSDLLQRNQEGALSPSDRGRLDELMGRYRLGLVRKAHALKVAVSRGLHPPLN
jgi:hypothetical protein